MTQDGVVGRLWQHDHTLWKPDPTEITNRLGWLHLTETMRANLPAIDDLVSDLVMDGYTDVLLLGMGGSSLAPEVFSETFGPVVNGLKLSILDSTAPGAVRAALARFDLARTLFIVATKSGGTVETLSFFKYFYNKAVEQVGPTEAGKHFVAITDPGSNLEKLAQEYKFRQTFLNDPNIGGRYSALSLFGLVPAALVGVNVGELLDNGAAMAAQCQEADAARNPGAQLGAVMGTLAQEGRNKLTLVASEEVANVVDWIEQLVAESTGKEGRGILPVVREPLGDPDVYGADRVFVAILYNGDSAFDEALAALAAAGHPVVRLAVDSRYDLGAQFMLWEVATAISGMILEINPFDQPNVEAAKVLARQAVASYAESGKLPEVTAKQPSADALAAFMAQTQPGDYVCLQAYVTPTEQTTAALEALRLALRDRYHLATAVGYGPRFLHSTGQLHKGDDGSGLFVQFVADVEEDASIPKKAGMPKSDLTFGTLIAAQAAGDYQALEEAQRRVVRFDLGGSVAGGIAALKG
jgi:glucose-6-phosphate isomerase